MRINMTDKTLDALQALAISLIPKKEESAASVAPTELTENQKRAARVKALIKAHYPPNQSGHSKAISHITAAILGVDVSETLATDDSQNIVVKKGTALMVMANTTKHGYKIGNVVFVCNDDEGHYTNCVARFCYNDEETIQTGDNLGLPGSEKYGDDSRYATEAEIIEEINKMRALYNSPSNIGF